MKGPDYSSYPVDGYDVTALSHTSLHSPLPLIRSIQRLFYLPHLLKRWNGPVSLTVFLKSEEEEEALNQFLAETPLSSSLTICRFIASNPAEYPYNRLRNIALRHVTTSHFWVMDMDMWPSRNAYETLLSLDAHYLQDEYLAVIVPAFEYKKDMTECNSFEKCVREFVLCSIPHSQDYPVHPSDPSGIGELLVCEEVRRIPEEVLRSCPFSLRIANP